MSTYKCTHKSKHRGTWKKKCIECLAVYTRPICYSQTQKFCSRRCFGSYARKRYAGESSKNFKHGFTNTGYKRITTDGGRVLEHRAVIESNLGRKLRTDEVVHHINGNKLDNRIENLLVTNRSEHRSFHIEDAARGESLPQSKLTAKDILEIRGRYEKEDITQYQLADIYGVGQDNISRIVNGIYWKRLLTTN